MTNLVRTTTQFDSFAHRFLWEGVRRQLEQAEAKLEGSWYFYLGASLLAYLTYEAYINYVGQTLAPQIWDREKEIFSIDPYRGTNGKLKKLCELYKVPFPDMRKKPFTSIAELKELRDKIVHARPLRDVHTAVHASNKLGSPPPHWLSNFLTAKKAKHLIGNLEVAIEQMHSLFSANVGVRVLMPYPLKGSFSSGIVTTQLQANPPLNRTRRKRRAG